MRAVDLSIDVTEAAGLEEEAHLAVTVTLPDDAGPDPLVCFAKPGGGYSRRYFTEDLPGPRAGAQAGAQAAWHAARGWIFVAVDHLGTGESSTHHDPERRLTYTPVVAAHHAAEHEVLRRLAAGTIADGCARVEDPVTIGIGQSMGGAVTVLQQGRFHAYDGIAVLGYGALHTEVPTSPGAPPLVMPWIPRDTLPSDGIVPNAPALSEAAVADPGGDAMAWAFHFDDIDAEIVGRDLDGFPARHGDPPPWASTTVPVTLALWCLAPGGVAPEAASIRVPVLVAVGERDVVPAPRDEPRAYRSSPSVDVFTCPRTGHMHNFAGSRELLWTRIHTWAEWVRMTRAR